MGKGALLLVFGASVVFTIMNLQLNKSAEQANQGLVGYFEKSVAAGLAGQSAEYLLARLADSSRWRVTSMRMLDPQVTGAQGDSRVLFSIRDVVKRIRGFDKEVAELRVEARYGQRGDTVVVFVNRQFGFVPGTIRGAITAQGYLHRVIGDMTVDGRNHDLKGAYDPTERGIYGISTSTGFFNSEEASIGGTLGNGADIAPRFPEDVRVVEKNFPWGTAFPSTPDAVVGFPDGTLKTLAKSGVDGSQYVTSPLQLKFPLRGITFVELPPSVAWKGGDLSGSQGLLIVHNESGSARMENVNTKDDGFRGLIIADYAFHLHADVLGAVFLLSTKLEVFKECRGNTGRRIEFSADAVRSATHLLLKDGTGWRGRVPILGWRN